MTLVPMSRPTRDAMRAAYGVRLDPRAAGLLRSLAAAPGGFAPLAGSPAWASLQRQGLVEIGARVTERGRWAAAAGGLGLTFLALCALADFFCMHRALGFAASPAFRERLEHCYSAKRLDNAISELGRAGLVYRCGRMAWRFRPGAAEALEREHGDALRSVREWMEGERGRMSALAAADPEARGALAGALRLAGAGP